jgi:uncharacterized protein (TIGR00730 family)
MQTIKDLRKIETVCVFCGSSEGSNPAYKESAFNFGLAMAHHNLNLVYGGGGNGLMGILAQGVKKGDGKVTGIIPTRIYEMVKHIEHNEDELVIVDNMHQRKADMYNRSDAFVALPGGIGTLEEVMEALTWLQLGYHNKPVALYDINGYYSSLITFFDYMVDQGFLKKELLNTLIIDDNEHRLIERLKSIELDIPAKIDQHT